MHLVPVFVLIIILVLAWRWEWIGAALYTAAGLLYVAWVHTRPIAPSLRVTWILTIAGPAFLIAALFLVNWRKRSEIRAGR